MKALSQAEAIVASFEQLLGAGNMDPTTCTSVKNEVVDIVTDGIMEGAIAYGKDNTDRKSVRSYVVGAVHCQMHRNTKLNGGVKYEPATKRGPIVKDEVLKKLLAAKEAVLAMNNAELLAQVEAKIEARKQELVPKEAPSMSEEEVLALLAS